MDEFEEIVTTEGEVLDLDDVYRRRQVWGNQYVLGVDPGEPTTIVVTNELHLWNTDTEEGQR